MRYRVFNGRRRDRLRERSLCRGTWDSCGRACPQDTLGWSEARRPVSLRRTHNGWRLQTLLPAGHLACRRITASLPPSLPVPPAQCGESAQKQYSHARLRYRRSLPEGKVIQANAGSTDVVRACTAEADPRHWHVRHEPNKLSGTERQGSKRKHLSSGKGDKYGRRIVKRARQQLCAYCSNAER